MNGSIGVTDNDWFAFLSQPPVIDEVNFRQPSKPKMSNANDHWHFRNQSKGLFQSMGHGRCPQWTARSLPSFNPPWKEK